MGETTLIVAVLLLFSFYAFAQSLQKRDLTEKVISLRNSYSTSSTIRDASDNDIYKTERWNNFITYALPVNASFKKGINLIKVMDRNGSSFIEKLMSEERE